MNGEYVIIWRDSVMADFKRTYCL